MRREINLQAALNQQAIATLPQIAEIIQSVVEPIRSSMVAYVLREIMNSRIALDDMSLEQKSTFESEIIATFKHKEWMI